MELRFITQFPVIIHFLSFYLFLGDLPDSSVILLFLSFVSSTFRLFVLPFVTSDVPPLPSFFSFLDRFFSFSSFFSCFFDKRRKDSCYFSGKCGSRPNPQINGIISIINGHCKLYGKSICISCCRSRDTTFHGNHTHFTRTAW